MTLTGKAAALLEAGLPWPDQPKIDSELRELIKSNGIPWWQEDVHAHYECKAVLGSGGFGKVYKATHRQDGRDVALKHIHLQGDTDREHAYKEIKNMTLLLGVKQIVSIYEVFESGPDLHIAMELCNGGELLSPASSSEQPEPLTYGDVARIAVCILILADGMHQQGFVHCDLKLENLCLSEPRGTPGLDLGESLRLIDFGLCQRVRGGQLIAGRAGSVAYMAPEVQSHTYDSKVDIWSIGVIIYTLLVGTLPFNGRTAEEVAFNAANREPDVSGLHATVADFVKWLLIKDPTKRPSARTALKHPWLASTDKGANETHGRALARCMSNELVQNLTTFAAANKLQRAFMHLSVQFLDQSEMTRILAGFEALPVDHRQPLTCAQMVALLTRGKGPEKARRIAKTIELVMGKDGELTLEDFVVASMNPYRNLSNAVVDQMFASLDGDRDGWITANDAFQALDSAGVAITLDELARLFERHSCQRLAFDPQHQGQMTFNDFSELMMPSVPQRFSHRLDSILAAFQHYNTQTHLQKLARRIVANHAPMTREMRRIKKCFDMIDVTHDLVITLDELANGIKSAGYALSEPELQTLFRSLDTDGTGLVRYHEFVAAALDHDRLLSDTMLRWIFEFMDDDNSGTIHNQNFLNVLDQMDWAENEKSALLEEVTEPGTSGVKLTFADFERLMKEGCKQDDPADGSPRTAGTRPASTVGGSPHSAADEDDKPLLLRSSMIVGGTGLARPSVGMGAASRVALNSLSAPHPGLSSSAAQSDKTREDKKHALDVQSEIVETSPRSTPSPASARGPELSTDEHDGAKAKRSFLLRLKGSLKRLSSKRKS